MVKILILATKEVKEVTKNEAHDLIDSGKAVLVTKSMETYRNKEMRASLGKSYKTK